MSTFTRIDKFTSLYVEPCHENVTIQRAHISAYAIFLLTICRNFLVEQGYSQPYFSLCSLNKLTVSYVS